MTRFAFAAKCGFFGASGFDGTSAAGPSSARSAASAAAPNPSPERRRNCRRMAVGNVITSTLGDGLVEVQDRGTDGVPRGELGRRHGRGCGEVLHEPLGGGGVAV